MAVAVAVAVTVTVTVTVTVDVSVDEDRGSASPKSMSSDIVNPHDFVCSICGESIPYANDDTVVWPDVRYEQKESVSETGQTTRGPYLTAHPACFERVKPGFNAPCPLCRGALAPIPTLKPNVGRWACSACKHEFARNEEGNFVGDDA